MGRLQLFLILLLLKTSFCEAQKAAAGPRLFGSVADESGEPLAGATVRCLQNKTVAATDVHGNFSLLMQKGPSEAIVSFLGFQNDTIRLAAARDSQVSVRLWPVILGEVVVRESKNDREIWQPVGQLSMETIKKIPALASERDPMKALSFLPGVTNGSEGAAGVFVRGGTPDQNLILLDHATVYNPNHLFGFLSVFNPDAIKRIDFYKGAFPARFGGRLSSVMDVSMKEGARDRRRGEAGIGLVASRYLLEGPILKKRGSFLVSARAAYLGLLLLPKRIAFQSATSSDYTGYNMADVNAKLNFDINARQKAFFSLYSGRDRLNVLAKDSREKTHSGLEWGNLTATARHTAIVSPRLFLKNIAVFSRFRHRFFSDFESRDTTEKAKSALNYGVGLSNFGIKSQLDFFENGRRTTRAGLEFFAHGFVPKRTSLFVSDPDAPIDTSSRAFLRAVETSFFVEEEVKIGSKTTVSAGVRGQLFRSEKVNRWQFEPRLAASFQANSAIRFFANAGLFHQNVHLLSSSSLGLQNDIWVPSTASIRPQSARQAGVGAAFRLPFGADLTVEFYEKRMSDLIDYREGFDPLASAGDWETGLEKGGKGHSRGIELGFSRQTGRWTGLLAYTFSKTDRQFSRLNNGEAFPFKYDFRHNAQAATSFDWTKKWSVSAAFVGHSGQPFSFPSAAFQGPPASSGGTPIYYQIDSRNNARLPNYLRTDIGASYKYRTRKERSAEWTFSIYNLLNRPNPFYAHFENKQTWNPSTGENESQLRFSYKSLFPILPSFGWSVKF